MANFVNKYNDMTAYNADSTKQYPNTSKVVSEGKVLFQRENPMDSIIVANYNVTSTGQQNIFGGGSQGFTDLWIDDVKQPTVVTGYTFTTTGEHIIKAKSSDTTIIPNNGFNNVALVTSVGGSGSGASVEIPIKVRKIDAFAFANCSNLLTVSIPDTVTDIGDTTANYSGTFSGCTSLTSVTIGSGVTSIGNTVFKGCTGLASITILATTPPTLSYNPLNNLKGAFYNTNDCPIYVPAESVSAYQADSYWSVLSTRIQAIPNP